MHIVKKILDDIEHPLTDKFRVYTAPDDWESFTRPLTDKDGEINKARFEERQNKSIEIIKRILDVHGKADIVKFLGQLASIEPKIQELQPWVRDHVVHAINTFLLGVYILEKVNFPLLKDARFDYPFMWKLCGPTHDLGYPVEIAQNIKAPFADKVNEILDDIDSPSPKVMPESYPFNLDQLCKGLDANQIIQKRLTEWNLGFDIKDYYKWLKKKNKTDHGIISALAQLKVIDALYYKFNPGKKYEDIRNNNLNFNQQNFDLDIVSASSALFIHNVDLKYRGFSNKISFDIAPLAFLLFLCDTFQEWDRFAEKRPVYSGCDFDIDCTDDSISIYVPDDIEAKVSAALHQRLTGLMVKVNGKIAVTQG